VGILQRVCPLTIKVSTQAPVPYSPASFSHIFIMGLV
jgi:hypothetical protein